MKKTLVMGKIFAALAVMFLMSTLVALPIFAAGKEITIKGSTTVLPIAQIAAEVYMDRNPDVDISVQGGGSGVGIASLIDKTTDIANSSRKIKNKEVEKAKSIGVDPFETVVAMDGIAVIVHPSNIKNYLTKQQIKDIYTGKTSNWSQIGGKDMRIVIISRDTSSGTFEAFENLAIDKERVRPDALTTASNQAVVQTVGQTPGAIGYAGLGYLSRKVKTVSVDGVKCTRETIVDGSYPLARPLYMYTNNAPAGEIKAFIDFVLSEEGQRLVEEEGFVGIR